jgi:hypothetical protein
LLFALALAVEDLNVGEMDNNEKEIDKLRGKEVFGHYIEICLLE